MLTKLHSNKSAQLVLSLFLGIIFGILLQKGGATRYDIILEQLLLQDFTVLKIMLAAAVTGMLGIYLMKSFGWVRLHPKTGSVGMTVIGGLLFGIGFATLGYCPGTIAGAIGQGSLDALIGGLIGILIGSGLFAVIYPRLQQKILTIGDFGESTLPQLMKINEWFVIIPLSALIIVFLWWLEQAGF